MNQIVDHHDVFEVSVFDDSEVLDVETVFCLHAVWPR